MAQYIEKSALVAEIDNWKQHTLKCGYAGQGEYEEGNKQGRLDTCEKILSFLETLEVKDVDLEIEQRMKECPYRQVVCTMYESKILECKGACSWVADYPKLKELKAQKGE